MRSVRKSFGGLRKVFDYRLQRISFSTRPVISHSLNEDEKVKGLLNEDRRPLWFIFPGLGAQLNQFPKELWTFEPFAESMQESHATLRNLGLDLNELMKPNNNRVFEDVRAAFACLSALQLALYDTLLSVFNTVPTGFIGHSAGELICGYADGCITAEQVLVISDVRGHAMQEGRSVPGAMAAVGMSWNDIQDRCPPGVYPACHNAAKNVTVSGSHAAILNFVTDLQKQGIFAKLVDSCSHSAHSPLASSSAELFRKNLASVIPNPKLRSKKWICTSARPEHWHLWDVSHCSGEYFVRNFLKPVWFYDALSHIPNKAVIVEVSPKSVFQGILKQCVPEDCNNFTPIQRHGSLNPMLSSEACSLLISKL